MLRPIAIIAKIMIATIVSMFGNGLEDRNLEQRSWVGRQLVRRTGSDRQGRSPSTVSGSAIRRMRGGNRYSRRTRSRAERATSDAGERPPPTASSEHEQGDDEPTRKCSFRSGEGRMAATPSPAPARVLDARRPSRARQKPPAPGSRYRRPPSPRRPPRASARRAGLGAEDEDEMRIVKTIVVVQPGRASARRGPRRTPGSSR